MNKTAKADDPAASSAPARFTAAELVRLDEMCRAATPGPWNVLSADEVESSWVVAASSKDDLPIALFDYREAATNRTDALFTAAARENMPRLVAEVQILLARVRDLLAANNAEISHRLEIQIERDTLAAELAAELALSRPQAATKKVCITDLKIFAAREDFEVSDTMNAVRKGK